MKLITSCATYLYFFFLMTEGSLKNELSKDDLILFKSVTTAIIIEMLFAVYEEWKKKKINKIKN